MPQRPAFFRHMIQGHEDQVEPTLGIGGGGVASTVMRVACWLPLSDEQHPSHQPLELPLLVCLGVLTLLCHCLLSPAP